MDSLQQLEKRIAIKKAFGGPILPFLLRHPLEFLRLKYIQHVKNSGVQKFSTFWGGRMHGVMPENVTNVLIRHGFHEEGLTKIFLKHVKPDMVVFDVGAHFGYFSLLAAHLVGPAGRVYAFEPTASTFEILKKNAHDNIQAEPVALFSRSGTIDFLDYGTRFSAFNSAFGATIDSEVKPQKIRVPTRTLDEYGVKPDFIKIDAEHAELDILKGGEKTILAHKPIITLEVGDYGIAGASKEPVQFLLDRGYSAFEYSGGELVPHVIPEKYTYENILFIPS